VSWLLDTCVLSEYVSKQPAPAVIRWLDEQDETHLFVSVISLGEIEKGILKLRPVDARRAQKLRVWFGHLERRFAGRTLAIDARIMHGWAQISASAEAEGRKLPIMDGLLMATAQCHDFTIVTRNVRDFDRYPAVFNPWAA
jgi:predicted nucleic acid-binding protein